MVVASISLGPFFTAFNRILSSVLIVPVNYTYSIDASTEEVNTTDSLITLSGHINSLYNRIKSFNYLEENWNGYGAVSPSYCTIDNTMSLLGKVKQEKLLYIHSEDIIPNPHGTISIEYSNDKQDWLNIEIGDNEVSFFYEIKNVKGGSESNLNILDKTLLSAIESAVNKIAENNEHRDSTQSTRE